MQPNLAFEGRITRRSVPFAVRAPLDAGPENAPVVLCSTLRSGTHNQPPTQFRETGSKETPGYLDIARLIGLWLLSCASDRAESTIKNFEGK